MNDKMFKNTGAEMGIRRVIRCVNKGQWQKIRIYIIKCKEK
jgi:hypothetical protein